jgi:penicillin amidase
MQRWTAALPELLEYPTATWFGADGDKARDTVLLVALADAVDELALALGDDMDDWRWGRLHRLRFVHNITTVLPCDEDLRSLLTAGVFEAGGDHDTVNKAKFRLAGDYDVVVVPTWRQVIDLADIDASLGSHTTGQSGNPTSPHWNDLCDPWLSGELHPLPFSRRAVEAATESTLVLEP